MRIGAIFARGSCRTLKWMALFGVLFALGAGSAAAQNTEQVSIKSVTIEHADADGKVGENVETYVLITLDKAVPAGKEADGTDPGPTSVPVTLTLTGAGGGTGNAESEDLRLANSLTATTGTGTFDEGDTVVRIALETLNDADAVDEQFMLSAQLGAVVNDGNSATDDDDGLLVTADLTATTAETFTIDDNETQTYVLKLVGAESNVKEDAPFMVNLYADPARPVDEDVNVFSRLESDNDDDAMTPPNPAGGHLINEGAGIEATPVELTITPDSNDGNRTDDDVTVMLSTFNSATGRSTDLAADVAAPLTVTILDVHQLPAVAAITAAVHDEETDGDEIDPAVVKEGETVYLFVTIENETDDRVSDTEEFTITPVVPAGNLTDLRITPASMTVSGTGEQTTGAFTVEAHADDDINIDSSGMAIMESIGLTLEVTGDDDNGGGETEAMTSIAVEDATVAQVSVADGAYAHIQDQMGADPLNPGDSFSLDTSMLFDFDDTMFDVSYGARADVDGVVRVSTGGGSVDLEAMGEGDAKVTVTATATPKASSLVITQTQDNVAQLTFPVDVDLMPLAMTVEADPPEIMEGGTTMITATANRPIAESDGNVKVNFDLVGDGGTWDEGVIAVGGVTFVAGQESAYGELTANEDDDYDDETLTVVYSGSGIEGSGQLTISVTDNDEAPTVEPTVKAKSPEEVQDRFDRDISALVGSTWTMDEGALVINVGQMFDYPTGDVDAIHPRIIFAVRSENEAAVKATVEGRDHHDITLTPVGVGASMISVTVTDPETGDTATVSANVTVTPEDLTLTVRAEPMEITEGGETVLHVSANRDIMASDGLVQVRWRITSDNATIADDQTTIAVGDSMATSAPVVSTDDDVHEEGETIVVAYSGTGIDGTQQVVITVMDDDEPPVVEPTVTANANAAQMILDAVAMAAGGADWMVGGMVATVDMADLFTVAEGASVSYAADSSMPDVVMESTSGNMLMLTPMGEGVSNISVTASDSVSMDVAKVDADVAVALQTLVIEVEASADTVMEGGSITLTATANRPVTAETMLTVTVPDSDEAVVSADAMITIAMGQMTGTAMVMALEDDDSADEMVSVVVSGDGISGGAKSFDIAITDNDPTVSALTQAEVDAVFTVAVATASGMDGWVPTSQGGEAATLDMGDLFATNDSPTLEYMAESDADMVAVSTSGAMLTLTPMAMGDATITVTATDTGGDMDTAMVMSIVMVGQSALMVTVSPETASIEEGGSVEITAMLNRPAADNVEVMLMRDAASTASEDDFSLAPSAMITIMAGDLTGMATLTATDDVMEEGEESLTLVARVKDMGDVGMVMVTIMASDPASMFTLSGPMDMNLVEGQSYELTVMADPAVQVDTEVTIMRDGSSSADDADFTVESVMLSAGDATGTTMLMVTDDGMDDSGHGMPEMLTVYGMADSGQSTNSLTFNLWDAAVPALPIIAQLLLAALLGVGGYRRYLRRR